MEKEPKIIRCPLCEGKFAEIYFAEGIPVAPPDKPYEGLVDSWGRYPVQTVEYEEPRYDCAPTRDLSELLKGLVGI